MRHTPLSSTHPTDPAARPAATAPPNPQSLSDQIRIRIATEVLRKTVPAILLLVAFMLIAIWLGGHRHESRLIPLGVLVFALAVVWQMVRSGHVTSAANLLIASLCLALLSGMILNGGVMAPAFVGAIPILAIVGWLYGVRPAAVFLIAIVVAAALFVWMDHQGWLRHVPPPLTPAMVWFLIASYLAVTFCATALPNRLLHHALADSETRRRELETTTRELAEREAALRETEQALRHEKALIDAIFDNIPGVIHLFDERDRLVRWNARATELSSFSDAELLNRPAGTGRIGDDRARFLDAIQRVKRDGRATIETTLITKSGNDLPIFITGIRMTLDGKPHILGIGVDIADRKRAEEHLRNALAQAEAASRAKDHFLAAASHELRTPLTPVLLLASALEADPRLPADARHDLAAIRDHVEVEKRLIGDLLDFTAIHAGKLHVHPVPTDAHDILRAALQTAQDVVACKHLRLDIRLDARRHQVLGDPDRLRQIFWNLLQNACKFTPNHGTVSVHTRDDDNHTLRVEITDTGRGMDAETLQRLFRPFEQGPRDEAMQHYGGLGLGLAISKTLVDAHRGSLSAISPGPNQGSTFTITLPLHTTPFSDGAERSGTPRSAAPVSSPPLATGNSQPATPLRILLVEDHPMTLKTLARLLHADGHDVTTAATVAEALQHAATTRFDLLLSDIGLPDGSGLDLMSTLHDRHALPGIALSGFGADADLEASRRAGFLTHLTKPTTHAALRAALSQFVARQPTPSSPLTPAPRLRQRTGN